jgi:hypothetical protein
MKRLLLLTILFANTAFAQDKVSGLGKFKLKVTTTAITDEVAKELNSKLKVVNNYSDEIGYKYGKPSIIELKVDTTKEYGSPIYAHECLAARVFYINEYTIANIKIKDIYLTFLNDTLVNIRCERNTELNEAFELKYGEPKKEYKEKEVKCTYTYTGADVTYIEQSLSSTWYNGDISCTFQLSKHYDSKCEKQLLSYCYFTVEGSITEITVCDRKIEEEREKRKKSEKKTTLGDL